MGKKSKNNFLAKYFSNSYFVLTFCAVILFLFYSLRLSTLTKGLAYNEVVNAHSASLSSLILNPFFLPVKMARILVYSIIKNPNIYTIRTIQVVFGLIAVFLFYRLINGWLGKRAAIIGTILFSTSAWMLHVSRLGVNSIIYIFSILLFLASTNILKKHIDSKKYFLFITAFIWPLLIYTPGMILLIGYNLYRQKEELKIGLDKYFDSKALVIYILSAIIFIPLLALSFIKNIANVLTFFGLPGSISSLTHLPLNLSKVLLEVFVIGPKNPELWLGRIAILDFFILVTAIIGSYFYITHLSSNQSRLLIFSFIIGVLITANINPNDPSILVPVMYILSTTGIALIIQKWMKVFPKNPIAKLFAMTLIVILLITSVIYNVRSYFIAWPHNSETKKVFIYKG